jgi:hypothetical protein
MVATPMPAQRAAEGVEGGSHQAPERVVLGEERQDAVDARQGL